MTVDNNPTSPYYGRFYVAWTDFSAGAQIYVTSSDDGITWSTPVAVSAAGEDVQAGVRDTVGAQRRPQRFGGGVVAGQ